MTVRDWVGYAVRADGTIVRWDLPDGVPSVVPGLVSPATFLPGFWGACCIRADGALLCDYPNAGTFTVVPGFEGP